MAPTITAAIIAGLFCVLLYHTYSRGGFLGFLVGLLALFHARFGWRRTLAVCGAYDPALQPCEIPNGATVSPFGG